MLKNVEKCDIIVEINLIIRMTWNIIVEGVSDFLGKSQWKNMDTLIIGIAGGSGSGKTTLAENIKNEFKDEILMLSHDYYYKQHDELSFEERQKLNYDHPNAFDTDMLIEHLRLLKQGTAIEHPVYSFVEHNREKYTVKVEPKKIILVDGILIFENKELADLMDIKIFVDTDADIRFIRRLVRDVQERGRTIDSVINQYCDTVKPMHEQFVEYSKKNADIIVPKGGNNLVALNMIREQVKNILVAMKSPEAEDLKDVMKNEDAVKEVLLENEDDIDELKHESSNLDSDELEKKIESLSNL